MTPDFHSAQPLTIAESATLTDFAMCINHYRLSTPGMHVCVHVPVQLNEDLRITPALIAPIDSGQYRQCEPVDYQYFAGPPNFVFDVFADDQRDVYTYRRELFEKAGVMEYVVWITGDKRPIWNRHVDDKYVQIDSDVDGVIRSTSLPGLWIPTAAVIARDLWSIMAATSQGVTRRGHRDHMQTVWKDTTTYKEGWQQAM
jgi:hypothetical protein